MSMLGGFKSLWQILVSLIVRWEYLHIVEGLEQLKDDDFSEDRSERFFELPLLLDEEVEAGGHVVHDDAEVAFLYNPSVTPWTSLRKYSRILMILTCSMRAMMLSSLFLYLLSCSTSLSAHSRPSFFPFA